MSESEPSPLNDYDDILILMHREAHFGGSFAVMLEYYRNGGKGIYPAFEISRIEELAEQELQTGTNLAALLFTAKEAEEVKSAKDAYEALRKLYSQSSAKNKYAKLIADLILAEEETPAKELEAIIQEKGEIVPHLIKLITSEEFYNPLFPGYGKAYIPAAEALGKIGDKRSLISLFESIGKGDFFDDEVPLRALKSIGEPAKAFLLKVVSGKPVTEDNEKAAIGLLAFKEDPQVALTCFETLKTLNLKQEAYLASYLILCCEGLKDAHERAAFEQFSKSASIPKDLLLDIRMIMNEWAKNP